ADAGIGIEQYLSVSGHESMGELCFETIGRSDEVLVEASQRQGLGPVYREVSAHELAYPASAVAAENESLAGAQASREFARLQDLAGNECAGLLRGQMRRHQRCIQQDVV